MNPRTTSTPNRRGTVMIIVLGLITIMLGLLLTVTISVYNGIKGSYDYQSIVQYYIQN